MSKKATEGRSADQTTTVASRPEHAAGAVSQGFAEATPFAQLQRTLGNQAMLQLLESGVVQAKLRVSQPGDADELEADRVANRIVSSSHVPVLQRKCSCSGAASCSKCSGEEEEKIHRSVAAPLSIQRATANPAASDPHAPPRSVKRPAQLIVENEATKLEHGQMKKSDFLKLLKSSTTMTADAALAVAGKHIKSGPYIEKWLASYEDQDSQRIERALTKYAPEAARAHTAREYIAIINNRVERAVIPWAKTGKLTGVPDVLVRQFAGGGAGGFLGALQGFASSGIGSSILGFLGGTPKSVQRKARKGGEAAAHDAVSVQTQLGSGHALDSRVQSQMSSAFGYDFSGVKVHTDSQSAALSSSLDARAFTTGKDVVFASGEYQPGTMIGDALIAHELAHVVQQGGGHASAPMTKSAGNSGQLEEDADLSAVGAVASVWAGGTQCLANLKQNAGPRLRSGLRLQRCSCSKDAATPVKSPASPQFADEAPGPVGDSCHASPISIVVRKSRDLSDTFTSKALQALQASSGVSIGVPGSVNSVSQHEEGNGVLIWSNPGEASGRETGTFVHDWQNNDSQWVRDGQRKTATDGNAYGLAVRPGSEARTKAEQKGFNMDTSDWEFVEDLVFTTTASDGQNVLQRCRWGFRFHAIQRGTGTPGGRTRNATVHYWGVDAEITTTPLFGP